MITAKEIIAGVEKNFPKQDQMNIKNSSDSGIEGKIKIFYQYVIGLTEKDAFGGGIDHYRHWMKNKLGEVLPNFHCSPWPFRDHERNDLKEVLTELSDYYDADLDIEKMIKGLNIKEERDNLYFIVITVIQVPILYAEKR